MKELNIYYVQLICLVNIIGLFLGTSIVNASKKILSDSNRKPSNIWLDQGSDFYNKSFKDYLKINDIEMYSTYNEGKSAVVERFIRTLKIKFLNI